MRELAEASGVSAGTIKHYLREGLLPEPVRTSRNMAYYPPEFVDRIRLIKQLQEERFMPLKVIKDVLDEDPERAPRAGRARGPHARARAGAARRRACRRPRCGAATRCPRRCSTGWSSSGVLTPELARLRADDVKIVEAISRFRAGGYDERIGFTVYDTLRYKRALEALVKEEVQVLLDRLAGEVEPERAVEMIEAGAEPLRDLIGALHSKVLVAELERQREARSRLSHSSTPADQHWQEQAGQALEVVGRREAVGGGHVVGEVGQGGDDEHDRRGLDQPPLEPHGGSSASTPSPRPAAPKSLSRCSLKGGSGDTHSAGPVGKVS